jgi:hypothetical protein
MVDAQILSIRVWTDVRRRLGQILYLARAGVPHGCGSIGLAQQYLIQVVQVYGRGAGISEIDQRLALPPQPIRARRLPMEPAVKMSPVIGGNTLGDEDVSLAVDAEGHTVRRRTRRRNRCFTLLPQGRSHRRRCRNDRVRGKADHPTVFVGIDRNTGLVPLEREQFSHIRSHTIPPESRNTTSPAACVRIHVDPSSMILSYLVVKPSTKAIHEHNPCTVAITTKTMLGNKNTTPEPGFTSSTRANHGQE